MSNQFRCALSRWKRKAKWSLNYLNTPRKDFFNFRCNICGHLATFPNAKIKREVWSCYYCMSTLRWRGIIHALSNELFGESLALPDFPVRPDIVGIGLSDWDGYASILEKKLSYTNTYYHQEPFLDITSIKPEQRRLYDFIICSDVFEHIAPPVSKAFENAQLLLKPDGVMIFTVPYAEGITTEHFPELYKYSLQKRQDKWILLNQTVDGRSQEFSDLTFHGGPGSVLEMRVFGKESLLQETRAAGFESVRIYDEEFPEYGLIHDLNNPAWALRKQKTEHAPNS
jgi:SAM-dependent methyltransferase